MRLVWAVIPLVLILFTIGIVGVQESFASLSSPISGEMSLSNIPKLGEDAQLTITKHIVTRNFGYPTIGIVLVIPPGFELVDAGNLIFNEENTEILQRDKGYENVQVFSKEVPVSDSDEIQTMTSVVTIKAVQTGNWTLHASSSLNVVVGEDESFLVDYFQSHPNLNPVPEPPPKPINIHPSPKKQLGSGVESENITCKEELELIFKSDNSPACVKPETAEKLIQRGWTKNEIDINLGGGFTEPEPPTFSDEQILSQNAKKALTNAYYENVNLGPLKINDVIVGFGIENNELIIDVLYRYSTSSEMDIVKKKIRNIVGDEIKIEYIPYKESSRFIQKALIYHWNEYLHKNNIEFAPAYPSHGNNDDGIGDGTFLCSPLVTSNGTEFYIISTVIVEPFLITDTFIDIEKPEFCRKTWKTDVILEEPDRVISLWLGMGQGKIPN